MNGDAHVSPTNSLVLLKRPVIHTSRELGVATRAVTGQSRGTGDDYVNSVTTVSAATDFVESVVGRMIIPILAQYRIRAFMSTSP